jgi:hypothetical protein
MTGFDEIMREGFDTHVRAITEAGGVPRKRARSAISAIRRRRVLRASTTTGASVLAVGAVAFGAMSLRPADDSTPVGPPPTTTDAAPPELPTPPPGSPAWCDLRESPQVNPAALGLARYEGRVYADYIDDAYVYVAPDGTRQNLEPDDVGVYAVPFADSSGTADVPMIPSFTGRMYLDFFRGGSGGGDRLDGVTDPRLLYEWTTTVPEPTPPGVNASELSQVLLGSLGFTATGFQGSAVPAGSVVETVFRWTDGHERTARVLTGGFGGYLDDYSGIESIAVRVTLPDGGTYEVTSAYDSSMTWDAACTSGNPTTPSSPEPTATPYLVGPETAVFRCLAPLPPEAENAIPTEIETHSGVVIVPEGGGATDFGPRGIIVTSDDETTEVDQPPPFSHWPGWSDDWGGTSPDGPLWGSYIFAALAWIDADGVIIGRQVDTPDPDGLHPFSGFYGLGSGASPGARHTHFHYTLGYVDSLGLPCDGVSSSALASASLVWLEGYGPDFDHMTWSWTRVPSAS